MLTLDLPPAVEQELKEKAARQGQTLEEYLRSLAIRDLAASPVLAYPPGFASAEEWVKAFREWAASHQPEGHFVDDSRESIYDGRGE